MHQKMENKKKHSYGLISRNQEKNKEEHKQNINILRLLEENNFK